MNPWWLLPLLFQDPRPPEPAPRTQPPEVRPLPLPRLVAPHVGDTKITVDGGLLDWPSTPPAALDHPMQLSGTAHGAWRGPDDLTALVFFAWDEEWLYVAAKIRDDWHIKLDDRTTRSVEVPPVDNFLVSFDPLRDTRAAGDDPGRSEDRELWFAEVERQGRSLVLWDRYRGTARYVADAAVEIERDAERKITTYEARVPWRELLPAGMVAKRGLVLNMQIVANDYDDPVDVMPQTRIGWTFGSGPRIDPAAMGTIELFGPATAGRIDVPEPPPAPKAAATLPPASFWVDLHATLRRGLPRITSEGDPADEGERAEALRRLEGELDRFPMFDMLEFCMRVQRRMSREADGFAQSGLPFFWDHALADVGRRFAEPPPAAGFRLFRLPQGGFLIRSQTADLALDPAGHELEVRLAGALEGALLTDPLDFTKRNDRLLLQLGAAKRPFVAHIAFPVPGLPLEEFTLVPPGARLDIAGLRVDVLGRMNEEGNVSTTVAQCVTWPDGTLLMHAAREPLTEIEAPSPDVLILSPRHPDPVGLATRLRPALIVLDDVLYPWTGVGDRRRVPLAEARALQQRLQPTPSVILAPGDSIEIPPRRPK